MLHSDFQKQKEINAALKSVKETYRRLYNIEYLKDIQDMIIDTLREEEITLPISAFSYAASIDEVSINVSSDTLAEAICDALASTFDSVSYENALASDTYFIRIDNAIDTLTK